MSEYLGKMNLYLEVLDRDVKKEYVQNVDLWIKLRLIDKRLLENKLSEVKKFLKTINKKLKISHQ